MYTPKVAVKAWIVCILAALFFSYELVQLHMLNAISVYLLPDLQINATQYGLLSSTYLLADVLFLVPAGMILDRFSIRKVILIALFLCVLGTFGFALTHSLATACFCHFLSGIGNAFCFLSCMTLVSRWFPKEKHAFVIGLVVTIGMLGGVIAQTPFSLLAQTLHWRNALLVDGLIGCVIFLFIYGFVYDSPESEVSKNKGNELSLWESVKRALSQRQTILCGLYTGLMNLPVMLIGAMWGSLFLKQIHHLSLSQASFVAGLICMGTIVGSTLFGRLSDQLQQKRPLMIVGALVSTTIMFMIMYLHYQSFFSLSCLFFLLGLFTSTQVLGYPIITESNPRELTATSMGVAALIIMGLAAIAQPLSGLLIDLQWDGTYVDQTPLYSLKSYLTCFWLFPLGFIIALFSSYMIEEPRPVPSRV